jgi:hypothetical protein
MATVTSGQAADPMGLYVGANTTADELAKGLGSGFQSASDAERAGYKFYYPGAANVPPPTSNISSTSTDSLTRVNDMLSKLGLSTAQSDDARRQEILNQEAEARRARASMAESIFGQKLARAETIGQQQIAGQRGITGQGAGFNMSTANMAIMNNVQKNLEDKKNEIEQQKQAYIDEGNWEASKRADAAIAALEERSLSILLKKADMVFEMDKQAASQDMDIAQLRLQVPEGQTVEVGGKSYTGLATSNPDTQLIQNDATGDVTVINKNTGEVINTIPGVAGQKMDIKEIGNKVYKIDAAGNMVDTGIRTPSGGGGVAQPTTSERQAIANDIAAIRGGDGFVDTAKYGQVRENIAVNAPKLLSWFDSTYSAQNVMNPNDPTAKKYFQTGTQQVTTANQNQFLTSDFLKKAGLNDKQTTEAMKTVQIYREAGYTDKEIYDKMQSK